MHVERCAAYLKAQFPEQSSVENELLVCLREERDAWKEKYESLQQEYSAIEAVFTDNVKLTLRYNKALNVLKYIATGEYFKYEVNSRNLEVREIVFKAISELEGS